MSKIARKIDRKRKLIIVLIIISVILGIILCILHAFNAIKEYTGNQATVKIYSPSEIETNPSKFSFEEILSSFDCEDITYEFKSNERYYLITLKFKYNLYEGKESKKDYFDTIVKTLSKKVQYPYELIDSDKSIDIYVDSSKEIYTINGIENFYKNNSYVKVNTHQEIPNVNYSKDSSDINIITANNWQRYNLNLNKEIKDIDEKFIYYDNFKLNYNDIKINYIVFSSEYEDTIYEDIKVGTDFKTIQKKLGNPTFKDGNRMIGYKDVDIYVFFYEDEVVVYPSSKKFQSENIKLENKIIEYYENSEEMEQSLFVKDIIETYRDFTSELIDDGVKLFSYPRGIDIFLYDDGSIKITIYDNYVLSEGLKVLAETNKINLNYETDSVYLYELNRE